MKNRYYRGDERHLIVPDRVLGTKAIFVKEAQPYYSFAMAVNKAEFLSPNNRTPHMIEHKQFTYPILEIEYDRLIYRVVAPDEFIGEAMVMSHVHKRLGVHAEMTYRDHPDLRYDDKKLAKRDLAHALGEQLLKGKLIKFKTMQVGSHIHLLRASV